MENVYRSADEGCKSCNFLVEVIVTFGLMQQLQDNLQERLLRSWKFAPLKTEALKGRLERVTTVNLARGYPSELDSIIRASGAKRKQTHGVFLYLDSLGLESTEHWSISGPVEIFRSPGK